MDLEKKCCTLTSLPFCFALLIASVVINPLVCEICTSSASNYKSFEKCQYFQNSDDKSDKQTFKWQIEPQIPETITQHTVECTFPGYKLLVQLIPIEPISNYNNKEFVNSFKSATDIKITTIVELTSKTHKNTTIDVNLPSTTFATTTTSARSLDTTAKVPIDEGLMRACIYTTVSTQVQAFFQGKLLFNNSLVSHLDNITLRCSDVEDFKFKGNRQLQCIDSKFNAPMPQCLNLLPNSPTSAPSLWLTTYPPGYAKVNEEGVVIIPRNSSISIVCWYSQSKPDIQIDSDVKFMSQKIVTFNRLVGWTTVYDSIPDITTLNYSCGVPGKTPKEDYTQYLEIKVADTCRLNENRIHSFGLLVDPSTRRYLYTENDQVNLICGGVVERAFAYMVCMKGGRWDFGPEIDCPQEESTTPTILTTT